MFPLDVYPGVLVIDEARLFKEVVSVLPGTAFFI
jgi:hypothetical protein